MYCRYGRKVFFTLILLNYKWSREGLLSQKRENLFSKNVVFTTVFVFLLLGYKHVTSKAMIISYKCRIYVDVDMN